MNRSVQVEEALWGLNWGNFFLFILISTGGLNTRWLLCTWTLWWNHHWPHGQSAGYNFYMFRNKMKQVARVWKWQVIWLACQAAQWILWQDRLTLGCTEHVGWQSRNCSETYDKIQYTNKENNEGCSTRLAFKRWNEWDKCCRGHNEHLSSLLWGLAELVVIWPSSRRYCIKASQAI